MKLAAVYFDDTVCIPGAKDLGSGQVPQDLRDSAFQASDGWAIERIEPGLYSLFREPMKGPAFVEGYGSTYTVPPTDAKPPRKAKP